MEKDKKLKKIKPKEAEVKTSELEVLTTGEGEDQRPKDPPGTGGDD